MNGDSEIFLSERPSPDGGEDFTTPVASEEEETWPDWDNTVSKVSDVYNIKSRGYNAVKYITEYKCKLLETSSIVEND